MKIRSVYEKIKYKKKGWSILSSRLRVRNAKFMLIRELRTKNCLRVNMEFTLSKIKIRLKNIIE
jgi:hypothetical protein